MGEGPVRFGPVCPFVSAQENLLRCNEMAIKKFISIKLECEQNSLDKAFADEMILRVAIYKSFSVHKSLKLIKNMNPYFCITSSI